MKPFNQKCYELQESIKSQLARLIQKYGTPSKYLVDSSCIKIDVEYYVEITSVFDNQDNIFLIDSDGLQYDLNVIGLDKLSILTDNLINKYKG